MSSTAGKHFAPYFVVFDSRMLTYKSTLRSWVPSTPRHASKFFPAVQLLGTSLAEWRLKAARYEQGGRDTGILRESTDYVSGDLIASRITITRTAVWKISGSSAWDTPSRRSRARVTG